MDKDIVCPSGIYAITNTVNGKKYIGSAVNLSARWRKHKSALGISKHHNCYLQSAWNKYGKDAFEFSVVEYVPDKTLLIAAEQKHIDSIEKDGSYNFCRVAGSILGVKRSPETLAKMRESGLRYRVTDETREKLRVSNTGKKATPEKLEKMSKLFKSPETIEKLRIAGTGRKLSVESVAKMIAFHTGSKRSPEAKEKMRAAKIGTKASPETRTKMSESQAKRRISEKLAQ